MNYSVRITMRAFNDLRETVRWWSEHRSRQQAEIWYEQILKEIKALADNPEFHAFARENYRTHFELRELHFGVSNSITHRVLFRVHQQVVEVLAIRHIAQSDLSDTDFV